MSCNNNSNKASVAGMKSGVSKIASKGAYAAKVAGGAGLGALVGSVASPIGSVAGAVYGGAVAAEKMAGSDQDKAKARAVQDKAAVGVGAAIGAGIGVNIGGLPGAAIGAVAVGAVANKSIKQERWLNSEAGKAAVATYEQERGSAKTQQRKARKTFRAEMKQARQEYRQAGGEVASAVFVAGRNYNRQERAGAAKQKGSKLARGAGAVAGAIGASDLGKPGLSRTAFTIGGAALGAGAMNEAAKQRQWKRSPEGKAASQAYGQGLKSAGGQGFQAGKTYRQKKIQAIRNYVGASRGAKRREKKATQTLNATMKRGVARL